MVIIEKNSSIISDSDSFDFIISVDSDMDNIKEFKVGRIMENGSIPVICINENGRNLYSKNSYVVFSGNISGGRVTFQIGSHLNRNFTQDVFVVNGTLLCINENIYSYANEYITLDFTNTSYVDGDSVFYAAVIDDGKECNIIKPIGENKFFIKVEAGNINMSEGTYGVLISGTKDGEEVLDAFEFYVQSERSLLDRYVDQNDVRNMVHARIPQMYIDEGNSLNHFYYIADFMDAHEKSISNVLTCWSVSDAKKVFANKIASNYGSYVIGTNQASWRRQILNMMSRWKQRGSIAGIVGRLQDCGIDVDCHSNTMQIRAKKFITESHIITPQTERVEIDGNPNAAVRLKLKNHPYIVPGYDLTTFSTFAFFSVRRENSSHWIHVNSITDERENVVFEKTDSGYNVILYFNSTKTQFYDFDEVRITFAIEPWGFTQIENTTQSFCFDPSKKRSGTYQCGGYSIGDVSESSSVDIVKDGVTVEIGGVKPSERYGFCTWVSGNKLVLFGGMSKGGVALNDTWIFDTQDLTWEFVHQVGYEIPMTRTSALALSTESYPIMVGLGMTDDILTLVKSGGSVYKKVPIGDFWSFDIVNKVWSKVSYPGDIIESLLNGGKLQSASVCKFDFNSKTYTLVYGGCSDRSVSYDGMSLFCGNTIKKVRPLADGTNKMILSGGFTTSIVLSHVNDVGIFFFVSTTNLDSLQDKERWFLMKINAADITNPIQLIVDAVVEKISDESNATLSEYLSYIQLNQYAYTPMYEKNFMSHKSCNSVISSVFSYSGISEVVSFMESGQPSLIDNGVFRSDYLLRKADNKDFYGMQKTTKPLGSYVDIIKSETGSVQVRSNSVYEESIEFPIVGFENINDKYLNIKFQNVETVDERHYWLKPNIDPDIPCFVHKMNTYGDHVVTNGEYEFLNGSVFYKSDKGFYNKTEGFEEVHISRSSIIVSCGTFVTLTKSDSSLRWVVIKNGSSYVIAVDKTLIPYSVETDGRVVRFYAKHSYSHILTVSNYFSTDLNKGFFIPGIYNRMLGDYYENSYQYNVKQPSAYLVDYDGNETQLENDDFHIVYDSVNNKQLVFLNYIDDIQLENYKSIVVTAEYANQKLYFGGITHDNTFRKADCVDGKYLICKSHTPECLYEPDVDWKFVSCDSTSVVFCGNPKNMQISAQVFSDNDLKIDPKELTLFKEYILENGTVVGYTVFGTMNINQYCYFSYGRYSNVRYNNCIDDNSSVFDLSIDSCIQTIPSKMMFNGMDPMNISVDVNFPVLSYDFEHFDIKPSCPFKNYNVFIDDTWQINGDMLSGSSSMLDYSIDKFGQIDYLTIMSKSLVFGNDYSYESVKYPTGIDGNNGQFDLCRIVGSINGQNIFLNNSFSKLDMSDIYIMSLPLADTRLYKDLLTYRTWRKYVVDGLVSPIEIGPEVDVNTRLIGKDDVNFSVLCNIDGTTDEQVVFGNVRSQVQYGTTIFNRDEFDGGLHPSYDPKDIDSGFVEKHSCVPSSGMKFEISLNVLDSISHHDISYLFNEMLPAHAFVSDLKINYKVRSKLGASVDFNLVEIMDMTKKSTMGTTTVQNAKISIGDKIAFFGIEKNLSSLIETSMRVILSNGVSTNIVCNQKGSDSVIVDVDDVSMLNDIDGAVFADVLSSNIKFNTVTDKDVLEVCIKNINLKKNAVAGNYVLFRAYNGKQVVSGAKSIISLRNDGVRTYMYVSSSGITDFVTLYDDVVFCVSETSEWNINSIITKSDIQAGRGSLVLVDGDAEVIKNGQVTFDIKNDFVPYGVYVDQTMIDLYGGFVGYVNKNNINDTLHIVSGDTIDCCGTVKNDSVGDLFSFVFVNGSVYIKKEQVFKGYVSISIISLSTTAHLTMTVSSVEGTVCLRDFYYVKKCEDLVSSTSVLPRAVSLYNDVDSSMVVFKDNLELCFCKIIALSNSIGMRSGDILTRAFVGGNTVNVKWHAVVLASDKGSIYAVSKTPYEFADDITTSLYFDVVRPKLYCGNVGSICDSKSLISLNNKNITVNNRYFDRIAMSSTDYVNLVSSNHINTIEFVIVGGVRRKVYSIVTVGDDVVIKFLAFDDIASQTSDHFYTDVDVEYIVSEV